LTGRVDFTDNLAFAGMLHAAVLRSPRPHARIRQIDTSRAAQLDGVAAIITGADALAWSEPVPGLPMGWAGHCLATDKVTFVGEPVAVVAATSRYVAEDALDLIEVEYDYLEPVLDPTRAQEPGSPLVHEAQSTNVVYQRVFSFGDVDRAFAEADLVVEDESR